MRVNIELFLLVFNFYSKKSYRSRRVYPLSLDCSDTAAKTKSLFCKRLTATLWSWKKA